MFVPDREKQILRLARRRVLAQDDNRGGCLDKEMRLSSARDAARAEAPSVDATKHRSRGLNHRAQGRRGVDWVRLWEWGTSREY